jgi:hypothetical protein
MKLRLSILLLAALAASPAAGQTIKSLGYNITNGQIVYSGTNDLRFPATIRIGTNQSGLVSGGQFLTLTDGAGGVAMIIGTNGTTFYDPIAFSLTANASTTRTNLALGATNNVTFSNITADGIVNAKSATSGTPTSATNARGIQWSNLSSEHAAIYGTYDGVAKIGLSVGTNSNSLSDVASFRATGMTVASNAIVGGTLAVSNTATFSTNVTVSGNATLNGSDNLMPNATTASSASSLMTRGLSDARLSPMPMTPQIVPWFYNGTLSVARVTNGSATIGALAAYPSIIITTNAADSGAVIMVSDVWGAVDSASNPWNAVNKSVIIQGRLAATASNAVARYVWSGSTNWPLLITNVGTNGISNIGWAVETRNTGGSNEARLIVNGATNKSESAWTAIEYNPGNDSSFMVIPRTGSTSLYWAQESTAFSRTPLITVTNQIGGSASVAFTGGLGLAVVNTNTAAGTSYIYIRRCYQVLGMTNYGY